MYNFYYSETCGNLVVKLNNGDGELVCCGKPMVKLEAKTADMATEKHVPVINRNGNQVEIVVGSTLHPMVDDHYIEMIAVVQGDKIQIAQLKPGDEPKATFTVDDSPIVAYEFCNKHGLWVNEEK